MANPASVALTIAVSKGRIMKDFLPLLQKMGIEPLEDLDVSRSLIIPTTRGDIKLVIIRPTDVPVYVEYGAADLGVTGKDTLLEYQGRGIYEPLDLKIGRCRLVLAGLPVQCKRVGHPRVATKYVKSTERYFAEKGIQVEIIKLYGSMELAPLVGLADYIVDLVDTGNTLRANGLVEIEKIRDISAQLIINKAASKIKNSEIKLLVDDFARSVELQNVI